MVTATSMAGGSTVGRVRSRSMANPTASESKPAGPSASDIKNDPGLAPENHVRGENLHKASTDRTAGDIVENAGVHDLWVVDATNVLVRADDEEAARGKFLGSFGQDFTVAEDVKVRPATPKDL